MWLMWDIWLWYACCHKQNKLLHLNITRGVRIKDVPAGRRGEGGHWEKLCTKKIGPGTANFSVWQPPTHSTLTSTAECAFMEIHLVCVCAHGARERPPREWSAVSLVEQSDWWTTLWGYHSNTQASIRSHDCRVSMRRGVFAVVVACVAVNHAHTYAVPHTVCVCAFIFKKKKSSVCLFDSRCFGKPFWRTVPPTGGRCHSIS